MSTAWTIGVGLLLLAGVGVLSWLLRDDAPPDPDDRVSRAWLEAMIRERRDSKDV